MKRRAKLLKGGVSPGLLKNAKLFVNIALAEDIGTGDVTTSSIVSPRKKGEAYMLAKEDLVLAGLFICKMVFKRLDRKSVFRPLYNDGDRVKKGRVIARVSGSLEALLTGERVALNFLQRLSGVATISNKYALKVKGTKVKLLDTRKTTPGLRALEKYAVVAGGAYNHRAGLYDRVLIKDNHIKAAGGIKNALSLVKGNTGPIEVETTNLKEVKEAIEAGAHIIMLDNMGVPMMKKAVRLIGKKALIEASGGVTLENIGRIARTGVDFISVGALTHSAAAVDISMEVE